MEKRVGGIVLSHGHLAEGLIAAAEMVVGEIPALVPVSIVWHDDVEAARNEISRALKQVDEGRGVLILTDLLGGAPTNIAAMFISEKTEIVTGVNLPMIIRFANQTDQEDFTELAHQVQQSGREEIYLASKLLSPLKNKKP